MAHSYVYETMIEMDISLTPKLTGDYKSAIVTTFHRVEYERRGDYIIDYMTIRRDWNHYGSSIDEKLPQPYLSDVTSRISRKWRMADLTLAAYIFGKGGYPEYMGDISRLNRDCMIVATYFNDDDTVTNECIG